MAQHPHGVSSRARILTAARLGAGLAAIGAIAAAVAFVAAPSAITARTGRSGDPRASASPVSSAPTASADTSPRPHPDGKDFDDATPSHYYVWCRVTPPYEGPRDADGIVMIEPHGLARRVYNPTTVAQWAIHFHENWLHTGDVAERDDFLRQAAWLRDTMDAEGRLAHPYGHASRALDPGWFSAMGQGIAVSVLLRAHGETGDESYMDAARRAMRPFSKDVAAGGVVSEGGKWLEEYPDAHHVLNGSIFAAFGVYDMVRATQDPEARRVWRTFTGNLAENLGRYESRGAILYELYPDRFCHPRYFDLHLRQLRALTRLTGDERFSSTAARWEEGFRAYPDLEMEVRQRPAQGGTVLAGSVRYLYDFYYGPEVDAIVTARAAGDASGTVVAVVPVTYDASRTAGTFAWTAPATLSDTAYRVTIDRRPVTPLPRYDHAQEAVATVLVRGLARR